MYTYLPVLIAVGVLLLLGRIQVQAAFKKVEKQHRELTEYLQTFQQFGTALLGGSFAADLYDWLTRRVNHIHQLLGDGGYLAEYTRPYTREVVYNLPIIPNL